MMTSWASPAAPQRLGCHRLVFLGFRVPRAHSASGWFYFCELCVASVFMLFSCYIVGYCLLVLEWHELGVFNFLLRFLEI